MTIPGDVSLGSGMPASAEKYWVASEVDAALATMKAGGLILVKGDIGYGLFGTSRAAIEKMYRIKGRPLSNPCIFVGNLTLVDEITIIRWPAVREWIEKVAELTTLAIVLPARMTSSYLETMDPWVRDQSVTGRSVAIFLRTGPYLEEVIARAFAEGWTFVGSSANRSLEGNTFRFEDLPQHFLTEADLVVNHGVASLINPERRATTIVDFTNWTIRREGVNHERIRAEFEWLRRRVMDGA